jgi:hypothetical protein
MLALLALALPVAGYEFSGFAGLAVGLGLAVVVQDAAPHRLDAFLERQPRWRWYVAAIVIVGVVGAATGHGTEATIGNATFVVVLLAIQDTINWLSNRRRHRQLRIKR